MQAIIFAFLAYFGWGIGDVLIGIASRRLGGPPVVFWTFIVRFILYTLLIPFFISNLSSATISLIILSLIIGVVSTMGYLAFSQAVRIANPALVASIALSWGAFSFLISKLLFRESTTYQQTFSIFIIFFGLFLSSFNIQLLRIKTLQNKGIFFALITFLCWGTVGAFLKFPIERMGWFWSTYFFVIPFSFSYFLIKKEQKIKVFTKKSFLLLLAIGLIGAVGEMGYNIGLSKGYVSIVAPIAGSYATLTVALSYFIFKDPISRRQKIGIVITLIGIVLLSALSR